MKKEQLRNIRWYQLHKQGFIERIYRSFSEVAKASLGLHSTDYWTPYISVWSRIGDYDAKEVFESLNAGRTVLRRRAFRNTLHVVHIENYGLILGALGPQLEKSMRQAPLIRNLTDAEVEELVDEIKQALKGGPLSMNELKTRLPHIGEQMRWLILLADGRGEIVRTSGSHARSTRLNYELASSWLKDYKIPVIEEEVALFEIIQRYISHFGPVLPSDISWWIPLKAGEVKQHLSKMEEEIIEVSIDGKKYLMTTEDLEQAKSFEPPNETVVNLLPYEDHFPKAFKTRGWYISVEDEKILFPSNREYYWPPEMKPPLPERPKGMNASGEIRPSIWADGRIVGRWELETDENLTVIRHALFAKSTKDLQQRVSQEIEDLTEFVNRRLMPIS